MSVLCHCRSLVSLGLALSLLGACQQKKDSAQCKPSLDAAQKATRASEFAEARKLRETAYKECAPQPALKQLDAAIVGAESAIQNKRALEARKAQEAQALVKVFLDFVAQNRQAPERASAYHVCDKLPAAAAVTQVAAHAVNAGTPAGDLAPSTGRFCSESRRVGARQIINVRYWEEDPSAFRFTIAPEVPLSCEAVGGKVAKTWQVKPARNGKPIQRWRCDLSGPLSGLSAIVTDSASASLHVISPAYLERDVASREVFDGS